ncbi:hypothetical protein [Agromyces sp. H66]|uniref:hypothetical protein n=1 Tax=Agromyces sp. H66 TaxID=2529859 RepID=UPI0010A9EB04|nr:hypothetical protein [Agromyces sp. H66]
MSRSVRVGAVAGAVALVFSLSGCLGGSAAPTSTPDVAASAPEASPTPTAEPVDPLTTVAALVARPESLELRDGAGTVVASLDYLAPAGPAIETLSTVFGAPPVDEEHPGNNHFPPTTAHRWDGFELWENRFVDRWADFAAEPRTLNRPSYSVVFTEPARSGIALTTVHGVDAGTPWTELEAMPGLQVNPSGCSGPYLDYIERDETWADGSVHTARIGVDFVDWGNWDAPVTVTKVRAPMPIYDGCA